MHNLEIYRSLSAIGNTLDGDADSPSVQQAQSMIVALKCAIYDESQSLLQHLCSLTVAERETILRVAEISAKLDDVRTEVPSQNAEYDYCAKAAARHVVSVERALRSLTPETWPFPTR